VDPSGDEVSDAGDYPLIFAPAASDGKGAMRDADRRWLCLAETEHFLEVLN
jgi:hypothetical protein